MVMAVQGNTVFCDDIRREDNGKALLIGVYTEDLVVQKLPTQLRLSFWIRLTGMDRGKYDITLRFDFPGSESFSVEGKAEITEPNETDNLVFVGIPATINEEGDITCNLIIADQTYEVGRITVQKAGGESGPNSAA